jgi:heparosan-N-sulfate-glucuronate 5-epimerase
MLSNQVILPKLPTGRKQINKVFDGIQYNPTTQVHVNLNGTDSSLGSYYLDLSETLADYSEFRYGEFDDMGVPMVGWGTNAYYSEVNIAQFAFIIHHLWMKDKSNAEYLTRLKNIFLWFETNKQVFHDAYVWPYNVYCDKYDIPAGFISGMTTGEVLSFYLRMYEIEKDPSILESAKKIFKAYLIPFDQGGFRRYDKEGNLWFEEFRSAKPSFILNGFIYAILGLFDLHKVTGDSQVKKELEDAMTTLKKNIHEYHTWYWSLYDQLKKELVMVYYQKNVHLPQMKLMYALSGEDIFDQYYKKWKRQLNPLNILFVKVMYRVKPRMDKLLGRV